MKIIGERIILRDRDVHRMAKFPYLMVSGRDKLAFPQLNDFQAENLLQTPPSVVAMANMGWQAAGDVAVFRAAVGECPISY